MADRKTTFALFFGNRGFFPASLIAEAREELPRVLEAWGHDVLMLDEEATRYGAVETPREGEREIRQFPAGKQGRVRWRHSLPSQLRGRDRCCGGATRGACAYPHTGVP